MKVQTFFTVVCLNQREVLNPDADYALSNTEKEAMEQYEPYDEKVGCPVVVYEVTFKPIKMKSNNFVDVSL